MNKKIITLFALFNLVLAPSLIFGSVGFAIFDYARNGYGASLFLALVLLGIVSGIYLSKKAYKILAS
jgi:uncharacterized PurR-regulated membrane protein YhhQ (DUF165 family)